MTPKQIKTMSPAEVAKHLAEHNKWHRGKGKYSKPCSLSPHDPYDYGLIVDRAIELLREVKMKNIREKYIVSCIYRDAGVVGACTETKKYDEAIEAVDRLKRYDKKRGKEYKYRITKQMIIEKVVHNEL